MSPDGAYLLRRAPGGAEFAQAWDEALRRGVHVLVHASMDRAIHGVPVPIMYRGQQVAERRVFSEKLAMFHLRNRLPDEFGGPASARDAHGRYISQAERQRQAPIPPEDFDRVMAELHDKLRTKLLRMHEHWRMILDRNPEHRAAHDLLFGPDGLENPDEHPMRRLAHLPPPLCWALIGLARDEERDEFVARLKHVQGTGEGLPD